MAKREKVEQEVQDGEFLLALDTLSGDVRDALLTHVRSMEDPWSKLSEKAQAEKINAVSAMAEMLVRRAAYMIAAQGFDHISINIGKFTAKDGVIKAEFETPQTHESLVKISDMQGRRSLLVLVDPDEYTGERAPVFPDPDQPELPEAAE